MEEEKCPHKTGSATGWARLTRREALLLFGGSAVSATLAGCGGSGSSNTNTQSGGNSNRTAISGDLTKQYNQFSAVAQKTTDTWLGASTALSALSTVPTRATRAPSDAKLVVQALTIGLNGTRAAYERLCNLALTLDDLGAAATSVDKNNSLSGSNAVNNEQWLATMILQNYAAVSVTGTLFEIQQVAGIPEARAWALARTAPQDRLVAYGLVADVFNTWVDALTAAGNITPSDAWKLDVSNAVTADNIGDKLNQIDTILPLLPFSPGYRKADATLAQTDDASLGATGIQNFAQTFNGALARLTLSTAPLTDTFPDTVDTAKAHYDVTMRLGGTALGQTIAAQGGLSAAQATIDTLIGSTDGTTWPGVTGDAANGQIQIISKIYGFIQAMSTALLTTQSALGSLITGPQAIQNMADLDTAITTFGSSIQQALWAAAKPDRDRLKSQQLYNGAVPTTRQVPIVVVTSVVELDQLGSAGIITNTLTVSAPDICPLNPQAPVIADYRTIISGLKKIPTCPRTFRNVLICIAGLLYDVSKDYPNTLTASWTSATELSFRSSDFVRMIRREPQATFAEIPAITSAQLLCTGVGYVPSKTLTPVDLSVLPAMPNLLPLTNLVGGVPINVH